MRINPFKFITLLCLVATGLCAQSRYIDSLVERLKTEKQDTVILKLKGEFGEMAPILREGYWDTLAAEAAKVNYPAGEAAFLNNRGYLAMSKGNIKEAIAYYEKSLKIREAIKDREGIANSYNNFGFLYESQNDRENAFIYYKKSLEIRKKINDPAKLGVAYNNVGSMLLGQKKYEEALQYFDEGITNSKKANDKVYLSLLYHNKGAAYDKQNRLDEALGFYEQAASIRREINEQEGLANTLSNIGYLYAKKKNYPKAINITEEALKIAQELGYPGLIKNVANDLKSIYVQTGNYKKAFELYALAVQMKDSVINLANKEAAIKQQYTYEFQEKENAIKVKAEIEKQTIKLRSEEEHKKQRVIIGSILTILVVTIVLGVFIYKAYRQKRDLSNELALKSTEVLKQKHIVDEKQKEILDSIHYAKRIQTALLANKELLRSNLPEHFILFKPKDIVSGDFYWATEHKGKFYLAVCDSTGHGVPGAFMSLLNMGFLSEAIKEKNIVKPNEVFDYVRARLISSIGNDGQKDGMDGVLLCYDKANARLEYAAANNAPVMVFNDELRELNKDRTPVGQGEQNKPFQLQTIALEPGSALYVYTDGYADQFGGPKGKKFKYRSLNNLLLANYNLPVNDQLNILETELDNWKGELEQVDDVCVIGLKF